MRLMRIVEQFLRPRVLFLAAPAAAWLMWTAMGKIAGEHDYSDGAAKVTAWFNPV